MTMKDGHDRDELSDEDAGMRILAVLARHEEIGASMSSMRRVA
jgi:hypothetical protein